MTSDDRMLLHLIQSEEKIEYVLKAELKKRQEHVMDKPVIRISVRNLVEFILRSGDLDSRRGTIDKEAMHKGSRLHRKLQKQMGRNLLPRALSAFCKLCQFSSNWRSRNFKSCFRKNH